MKLPEEGWAEIQKDFHMGHTRRWCGGLARWVPDMGSPGDEKRGKGSAREFQNVAPSREGGP